MRILSFRRQLRKSYPIVFGCIVAGLLVFTRTGTAQEPVKDFKTLLVQETAGLERTAELVIVDASVLPVPSSARSVTVTDADGKNVVSQIEDVTCLGLGRRLVFLLPILPANGKQTCRVVFSDAPDSWLFPVKTSQDKDVDGDSQPDLIISSPAGEFRQISAQGGVLCYLATKDATFSFINAFNRPSVSFWLTPPVAPTEILMTVSRPVKIGSLPGFVQAGKPKVVSAGPCTVITETTNLLDSESGQYQFTNVYRYRADKLEVEAWGIFRCNKSFSSETAAMVCTNDILRREGVFFSSTPAFNVAIEDGKQYTAALLPGYFGFIDPALEWSVSVVTLESGQNDVNWYKKNRTNGQAVSHFAWGEHPFSRDFTANLIGEEHFGPDHRPFFAAARTGFTWSFHAWLIALEGKQPQVESVYQGLLAPVKVSLQP